MPIVERHTSPDGLLDLIVDVTDGDWSIGFDRQAWHTHGDILKAWRYEGSPERATRALVDDILASKIVIYVYRKDGEIDFVAIPSLYDDHPLEEDFARYAEPGETLELRYWNGDAAS